MALINASVRYIHRAKSQIELAGFSAVPESSDGSCRGASRLIVSGAHTDAFPIRRPTSVSTIDSPSAARSTANESA